VIAGAGAAESIKVVVVDAEEEEADKNMRRGSSEAVVEDYLTRFLTSSIGCRLRILMMMASPSSPSAGQATTSVVGDNYFLQVLEVNGNTLSRVDLQKRKNVAGV
jgi:hypothetical protein